MNTRYWSIYLWVSMTVLISWHAEAAESLLDTTFDPGTGIDGGLVETVLPQPDGKILICGNFTKFNGADRAYIARLNTNGSVDMSFHADVGYWVRHMALQ